MHIYYIYICIYAIEHIHVLVYVCVWVCVCVCVLGYACVCVSVCCGQLLLYSSRYSTHFRCDLRLLRSSRWRRWLRRQEQTFVINRFISIFTGIQATERNVKTQTTSGQRSRILVSSYLLALVRFCWNALENERENPLKFCSSWAFYCSGTFSVTCILEQHAK